MLTFRIRQAKLSLWAAVARRECRSGTVIGLEQCLSRSQALHAFTMGGARCCGVEAQRGTLEAGKLADLAVLSDDPLQIPEAGLQISMPTSRSSRAVWFMIFEQGDYLLRPGSTGLHSGILLNGALSALAHTSHQPVRDDLFAAMREGGMRAFLDKRDTPFRPEPFGPRSTGR